MNQLSSEIEMITSQQPAGWLLRWLHFAQIMTGATPFWELYVIKQFEGSFAAVSTPMFASKC